MNRAKFMDRIFDTINELDILPIQDIVTDAAEDIIKVYLMDGTMFEIKCEDVAIGGYCIEYGFIKSVRVLEASNTGTKI